MKPLGELRVRFGRMENAPRPDAKSLSHAKIFLAGETKFLAGGKKK